VHTDPQSAFRALTTSFENVVIDVGGAQDFVPAVDTKIRRVKEIYRAIKSTLPWPLPNMLVQDLVAYVVSRLNMRRTTAINHNVAPRVMFTGLKADFRKEMELSFGDYCEVYDGTENTSKSRSIPCVALYPCCNATGSWVFLNLVTKKRVRRSQWKRMMATEEFIVKMKAFVEVVDETLTETNQLSDQIGQQEEQPIDVTREESAEAEASDDPSGDLGEGGNNEVPALVPQEDEESDDEAEESEDEEDSDEAESEQTMRRSERIRAGVKRPDRYAVHTKLRQGKHNSDAINDSIEAAEREEIKLVFEELKAVEVVRKEDIPVGIPAFNSHLFTIEKFKADGSHDKYKSRLVAHGNEQDDTLYPDRASPTAQLHSIMACLAIAACNEKCSVGKLDVKGAFIQTEMTGTPVYIKCAGKLKNVILRTYPKLADYVSKDGVLHCKLLKALYGCVQASKLWYLKLSQFLEREGYQKCEVDPCIFRRVEGEMVHLLIIYVDDVLIVAPKKEIDRLQDSFIKEFKWVTLETGSVHSYLGMQLEFTRGCVKVDMRSYLDGVLGGFSGLKSYQGPAGSGLFDVASDAEKLGVNDVRRFHTVVAKLLYLSKRARPDIIATVSFLCTRVKEPTTQDRQKLFHLLGYLQRTKERVLKLRPRGIFRLEAYIDASFALHTDGKSHTGVVILLGGVGVFFASRKQKCVSKSPTEAELVALSDNVGFVELFHEFVSFVLNCKIGTPTVYQDNTSVISLVTIGGGVMRTKHLRTRMYLVMEALKENRVRVKYVHTSEMFADGLTKVLDGADFDSFANKALNG
jgi:hypothetical protein